MKFKDLNKGDTFRIDGKDIFIKTMRIKDGNDGCFYTGVSLITGIHYKILDDMEVYKMSKKITENENELLVLE